MDDHYGANPRLAPLRLNDHDTTRAEYVEQVDDPAALHVYVATARREGFARLLGERYTPSGRRPYRLIVMRHGEVVAAAMFMPPAAESWPISPEPVRKAAHDILMAQEWADDGLIPPSA